MVTVAEVATDSRRPLASPDKIVMTVSVKIS